jgi:hypothetical protein
MQRHLHRLGLIHTDDECSCQNDVKSTEHSLQQSSTCKELLNDLTTRAELTEKTVEFFGGLGEDSRFYLCGMGDNI